MINDDIKVHYAPVLFDSTQDREGFIKVYKEAFAGAPYYETYTTEDVLSVWYDHFNNGRIILAKHGSKVIGLGCLVPLHAAPEEVQAFLTECKDKGYLEMCKQKGYAPDDFTSHNSWYMSELAVLDDYRMRGIAYELVRHRLIDVSHSGSAYYVMRTDTGKSNSMHLYLRTGAEVIPVVQDVSEGTQVQVNGGKSTSRTYLFGSSSLALRILSTMRHKGQEEGTSDEPETPSVTDGTQEDAA